MERNEIELMALTEEQRNELAAFGASVLNIVGLEGGIKAINKALCELTSQPNEELSELMMFLLEVQKAYIMLYEQMLEKKKTLLGLTGVTKDNDYFNLGGKIEL